VKKEDADDDLIRVLSFLDPILPDTEPCTCVARKQRKRHEKTLLTLLTLCEGHSFQEVGELQINAQERD